MKHTKIYFSTKDENGKNHYKKIDEQGKEIFESLEDIFNDPDFNKLVAEL